MNYKNEIFLKLMSSMIIDFLKDFCKKSEEIIFNESECSGYKSIRFSTKRLNKEIKPVKGNAGYFKNGHFAYYELKPGIENWTIYLNISKINLPINIYEKINLLNKIVYEDENIVTLYKKEISLINDTSNTLLTNLDLFLNNELSALEHNLFDINNRQINEDISKAEYIEGLLIENMSIRYERNQLARKKCIEYHGATCKICGFNFANKYGEEFKDKIEVHHIVPLYKIKKEYIVDPINDLIPVCPNCHLILHSKTDGVYSIDEVIKMIQKNNKEQ